MPTAKGSSSCAFESYLSTSGWLRLLKAFSLCSAVKIHFLCSLQWLGEMEYCHKVDGAVEFVLEGVLCLVTACYDVGV